MWYQNDRKDQKRKGEKDCGWLPEFSGKVAVASSVIF